jgi:hypothetical protein
MMSFFTKGLVELWVAAGTKFGKAQKLSQVTPTPDGYRLFGDIQEGDYVFDEHGKPTKVLYTTDLMFGRPCYEVTFSDGQKIQADADHLWETSTHYERKNVARVLRPLDPAQRTESRPQVRTTLEILESLNAVVGGKKRPNHSIPCVSQPVEFKPKDLPLDPYVLGIWLGDGGRATRQITTTDDPILVEISKSFEVKKLKSVNQYAICGLTEKLRECGVFEEKKIPEDYLISSPQDRLSLICGLMDSDGTISASGACCFDNTNKNLADGIELLLMSMGVKTKRKQRLGKLNGEIKKLCYRVQFTTDLPVFRLPRKKERLREISEKSKRRYIVDITMVPTEPVKCISVENPTSLYLTGEACIPTHNTLGASGGLCGKAWVTPGGIFRWVAPVYSQAKYGQVYCKKMLPTTVKAINSGILALNLPNDASIEFRSGKNPEDLEGEGVSGGYGLDECAKMGEQVYDSAKTTVTVTRAPIVGFSTPKGKNWFHRKCMNALDDMEWCKKNGKAPTKLFMTAPSSSNPHVTREALIDAQKSMPERLFRQYYLAEFIDDSEIFSNFKKCIYHDAPLDKKNTWFHRDCKKKGVVVGVDWAKHKDHTVFGAISIDEDKPKLIAFMRFQGLSYPDAVRELVGFCSQFAQIGMIYHDKTGVGDAIDDILAYTKLPFHGIVFTNQLKASMVNNLIVAFEREQLLIPWWEELIRECESYEVQTTETGMLRYNAPQGLHDDIVAMLLLVWAATLEYAGEFKIRFLEELPKEGLSLDNYYQDMMEEDDIFLTPGNLR